MAAASVPPQSAQAAWVSSITSLGGFARHADGGERPNAERHAGQRDAETRDPQQQQQQQRGVCEEGNRITIKKWKHIYVNTNI